MTKPVDQPAHSPAIMKEIKQIGDTAAHDRVHHWAARNRRRKTPVQMFDSRIDDTCGNSGISEHIKIEWF